jgi:4-hydroxybenzoate polyprenyltransferase
MTSASVTHQARLAYLLRLAWQEARPVVQLIFMLRFLAGVALGRGEGGAVVDLSLIPAAVSWLAATWAIYLLNGVADTVEDRANGSARPIARGDLPARSAAALVWLLCVVGLCVAAFVSKTHVVLVALLLGIGWAYSMGPRPLKNNMVGFVFAVTALGLLTYLAGWHATAAGIPGGALLLFGMAMSMWMGLGGATKDLSDTKGDRLAGRRTLPVLLGERRARIAMVIGASLVGGSFLTFSVAWMSWLLLAAAVACAGSAALAVVALTPLGDGDRCAKRRPYRVFMVTQYLTHLTLFATHAMSP